MRQHPPRERTTGGESSSLVVHTPPPEAHSLVRMWERKQHVPLSDAHTTAVQPSARRHCVEHSSSVMAEQ